MTTGHSSGGDGTGAATRSMRLYNPEVPAGYGLPPTFDGMVSELDVRVPMRDGVEVAVDIFRPPTDEPSRSCSPLSGRCLPVADQTPISRLGLLGEPLLRVLLGR